MSVNVPGITGKMMHTHHIMLSGYDLQINFQQ